MVKRTRRPCWQAQTASPVASIVVPVPGSPTKITLSRSSIQEPSASAAIVACGTFGLSANRNSSSRLISGKRASISLRRSRRFVRSWCSASSSAARYAIGVCCSRVASSASARKRRLTVGSLSSVACASISASSAWVFGDAGHRAASWPKSWS